MKISLSSFFVSAKPIVEWTTSSSAVLEPILDASVLFNINLKRYIAKPTLIFMSGEDCLTANEFVKIQLGGVNGLEDRFGKFWKEGRSLKENVLAILRNYYKRKMFTWRYNRGSIDSLIKRIESSTLTDRLSSDIVEELYRHQASSFRFSSSSTTSARLKYILLHCSGLYTASLRAEVQGKLLRKEKLSDRKAKDLMAEMTDLSARCPSRN